MRPRRRLGPLVAAALAIAGLGGCGGAGDPSGAPAARPSEQAATRTDDGPGRSDVLRSFTAPAIGGGEVDAATFRGRPTLLWFWAPW